MVHHRPGRIRFRIRLASQRDADFFEDGELPPPPKPVIAPAPTISRFEDMASNLAWARAALHRRLRGDLGWGEAAGMGLYGALLLMLLGRQIPHAPQEGLPLRDAEGVLPVAAAGHGHAVPGDTALAAAEAAGTGAEAAGQAEAAFAGADPMPGLPRGLHGSGGGPLPAFGWATEANPATAFADPAIQRAVAPGEPRPLLASLPQGAPVGPEAATP
ncbi:hypothetical protein, partial [Paracraurococcus ruber]